MTTHALYNVLCKPGGQNFRLSDDGVLIEMAEGITMIQQCSKSDFMKPNMREKKKLFCKARIYGPK
jgi:hypothetical protein